MRKKRLVLLSGLAFVAVLLVGLAGAAVVSAQEPTPDPEIPFLRRGPGPGFGGHGFFRMGGGQCTTFDAAAEALGLTPTELFAELHAGKTLDEVAEEQGVEMEVVQEAMWATRTDAMRQAIEQAVEDGAMSQGQADWMLEGLDQGFFPMGRGLGRARGWHRCSCPEGE